MQRFTERDTCVGNGTGVEEAGSADRPVWGRESSTAVSAVTGELEVYPSKESLVQPYWASAA